MAGRARTDPTKQHWEDAEFPILCQTCLGDNPYIRMTKERFGKECKICTRPFTVFRWCPGKGMRFKKTEVCQTCAKLKNVCQTCIFDLEYGLPVEVRDRALGMVDNMPKSDVNREYYAQNMEKELAGKEAGDLAIEAGGKASPAGVELLKKLARNTPYYKRNRAHICSFWVKGECKRGDECPYRHEMPTDPGDPLSKQNIKDRFYGTNDPVADKMMQRAADMPKLEPPADDSVMTLYLGGVAPDITEQDIRDQMYQYGEIAAINLVARSSCAFVTYTSRRDAEKAADGAYNTLVIKGKKLKVMWGRSQSQQSSEAGTQEGVELAPIPGLPMANAPQDATGEFKRPLINAAPAVMPPGAMPPPPPPPGFPPVPPGLPRPPCSACPPTTTPGLPWPPTLPWPLPTSRPTALCWSWWLPPGPPPPQDPNRLGSDKQARD